LEINVIDMLEKKIRRSIIETKEQKEKKLIEEHLVKSRLLVLVEHIQNENVLAVSSETLLKQFLNL